MPNPDPSDLSVFFTVRAAQRGADVFVREIHALRQAMRQTRNKHPFEIAEIVVMGDVIHAIWTLPQGDTDFAIRWRMIKTRFSRAIPAPDVIAAARQRTGEKGVWQRRFWEHAIRDPADLVAHRRMIWTAPVQAGLVKRPEDWPHSSVHRAISRGDYDPVSTVHRNLAPVRPSRASAQLRAVS